MLADGLIMLPVLLLLLLSFRSELPDFGPPGRVRLLSARLATARMQNRAGDNFSEHSFNQSSECVFFCFVLFAASN